MELLQRRSQDRRINQVIGRLEEVPHRHDIAGRLVNSDLRIRPWVPYRRLAPGEVPAHRVFEHDARLGVLTRRDFRHDGMGPQPHDRAVRVLQHHRRQPAQAEVLAYGNGCSEPWSHVSIPPSFWVPWASDTLLLTGSVNLERAVVATGATPAASGEADPLVPSRAQARPGGRRSHPSRAGPGS